MFQMLPVLLFAAAGVWVLWVSRRGPKVIGGEPCCSRCGYLVRGLPGPICPECGADLAQPGAVTTSGGRRPAGKWRRALGWSAFCFFTVWIGVTFIWWQFIMQTLPRVREVRQDYMLANPASAAYDSIQIRSRARAAVREGQPEPHPASIKLELRTSNGSRFDLDVDTNSLAYRYTFPNGAARHGGPLDTPALLAWLHDAGVQGDPARLSAEMDLVLGEVRSIQQAGKSGLQNHYYPAFSMTSSRGSLSTTPLPYVEAAPIAFALIVWAIGLLFIMLRNPVHGEPRGAAAEATL